MVKQESQKNIKFLNKMCECGKVIIGTSQGQLDFNMKQHLSSKFHKEVMELLANLGVVKRAKVIKK